MKKVFLFLATGALFLSSCSTESNDYPEARQTQETTTTNKTLEQLREYNTTLPQNTLMTRSSGRTAILSCVDAYGGIRSIWINRGIIATAAGASQVLGGIVATCFGISGAASASASVAKILPTDAEKDNMFTNTKDYCRSYEEKMKSTLIDSDSPVVGLKDTLQTKISVPLSCSYLMNTGAYHNAIIEAFLNPSNDMPIRKAPMKKAYKDHADPGTQLMPSVTDMQEFWDAFYVTADNTNNYNTNNDFNIDAYIAAYPIESNNVRSAFGLFKTAIENNVQDGTDMISIVNSYISIIDGNTDFTSQEREAIYAGLIISVYSYHLWYANPQQ